MRTAMERLKIRLPTAPESVLAALLEEASGMILAFTGRQRLPPVLETAQVQLAASLYNRMGIEGETAHAEGGVSRTMEALPDDIRRQIAPYRVAKVVMGHAAEGKG